MSEQRTAGTKRPHDADSQATAATAASFAQPSAPPPSALVAEVFAAIARSKAAAAAAPTGTPATTPAATAVTTARAFVAANSTRPRHPAPTAASAVGPAAAAASSSAAQSAAHSNAPPLSFSSVSHDEFSVANKHNPMHSNSNSNSNSQTHAAIRVANWHARGGGGAAGGSTPGAAAGGAGASSERGSAATASAAAATSLYRSPLSSRPLVRTLVAVLHALCGHIVKVELRNETCVRGRLEDVDPAGNLRLSGASSHRGSSAGPPPNSPLLECMFVPGRSVRFVHIPARVDAAAAVTAHEMKLDANLMEFKRKKRQGKFVSREEQIKAVDRKEAKLREEIAREEAEAAAAASAAASGSSSAAAETSASDSHERDGHKRQKL